jgi:hypothetical protein
VASFGAPVDPGNLLMVAYLHHDGSTRNGGGELPVLGAPGCAQPETQRHRLDPAQTAFRGTPDPRISLPSGTVACSMATVLYQASTILLPHKKLGQGNEMRAS